MSISLTEVRKIAQLARIKLSPTEEERHAETISAVLEYMKILNEVDTGGVVPTAQVTGLEDVVRIDQSCDCLISQELIKQMPSIEDNELMVPAVFGSAD